MNHISYPNFSFHSEQELNLTIKQKDSYIDEIRNDMDKQLCQFQMEAISLSKMKQKLEMEIKRINIDLDGALLSFVTMRTTLALSWLVLILLLD